MRDELAGSEWHGFGAGNCANSLIILKFGHNHFLVKLELLLFWFRFCLV